MTAVPEWSGWLAKFLAVFRQPSPMPAGETDLYLGDSPLVDDGEFVAEWLSFVANATGQFELYSEFLRRFRESLTAPRRPLAESPNPKYVRDRATFLQRSASYHVALERYRRDRGRYEARQRGLDTFTNRYSADPTGYIQFVDNKAGGTLSEFLARPHRLPILEAQRRRHTLVVGASGSGKSEILKGIVHHYMTRNTGTAIVILDPHGDLALDVARFRENVRGDRLVFIDLGISDEQTAVINPFEVGDLSDRELDVAKQELIGQLGSVLGERAELSSTMEAVISPCVSTLLRMPGATIADLRDFLDEGRNERLLEYAFENLSNPQQIEFLRTDFANTRNDTRLALKTKLQLLLDSDVFRNFLVGRSTIDLEREIEANKLIIFTLSTAGAGESVGPAIGRLVMAKLMGIASRRALLSPEDRQKCAPIHCIVDEAQNVVSPSMRKVLDQARKFRLHLTLASQYLGQFTDVEVRSSIEQNCAVKLIGLQNQESTRVHMAKLAGTTAEKIGSLATGDFFVKIGAFPGYTLRNDTQLLGGANSMTDAEWDRIRSDQLRRYYRPIEARSDTRSEPCADDESGSLGDSESPTPLPLN